MDGTVLDLNPLIVLVGSFVLIGVAIGMSLWLRLRVERSIVEAAVRAAVQLIIVGFLLSLIVGTGWEHLLAPAWIVAMVVMAASVVARRSRNHQILIPAAIAIGAATGLSLGIVFGLGVLPPEPIQLIVIAGITIGNTLGATVVAADQVTRQLTEGRATVEGLLALGIDAKRSSRFLVAEAVRVALIPQIERTKVVGLITLPGAFAGLMIAGVDPFDAAVVQLVVMYLVVGSVAVSASVVALVTARSAFTPDQRLAS